MSLFEKLKEKGFLIVSTKVNTISGLKELIYMGSCDGSFQTDYFFYHDKLSVLRVYGCGFLHREMSQIEVGTRVFIHYMGKIKLKTGKFIHKVLVLKAEKNDPDLIAMLKEDL